MWVCLRKIEGLTSERNMFISSIFVDISRYLNVEFLNLCTLYTYTYTIMCIYIYILHTFVHCDSPEHWPGPSVIFRPATLHRQLRHLPRGAVFAQGVQDAHAHPQAVGSVNHHATQLTSSQAAHGALVHRGEKSWRKWPVLTSHFFLDGWEPKTAKKTPFEDSWDKAGNCIRGLEGWIYPKLVRFSCDVWIKHMWSLSHACGPGESSLVEMAQSRDTQAEQSPPNYI